MIVHVKSTNSERIQMSIKAKDKNIKSKMIIHDLKWNSIAIK
jgi:hypothetical protein